MKDLRWIPWAMLVGALIYVIISQDVPYEQIARDIKQLARDVLIAIKNW